MNRLVKVAVALVALGIPPLSLASSHREAPTIAGMPRLDGTDLYMFRSYESGRQNNVTFIANYIPLQDPAGGPNFYKLDPNAAYAINIDNTGEGVANMQFLFYFTNIEKHLAVDAGNQSVQIPLLNSGPVNPAGQNLNDQETYKLYVRRNDGSAQPVVNYTLGTTTFYKPTDNIGEKSIPDYAGYAQSFVYDILIPGCPTLGRVFVGQRKEGFVVNLGEIFDLVNLNPAGPRTGAPNTLSNKNITSLAIEVPISCLVPGNDPVIGAWTTASVQPAGSGMSFSAQTQMSRLGMPLVNEVVIGLADKDKFNGSQPHNDAQFLTYVTNPSLPVLLNALFGAAAIPPQTPRQDLVAAFLTGVHGLNQPLHVTPAELLRLNTSIAPTPPASQNDLGVLGGDLAGFPNGRRPYDDVVDITLRVAMGALCGQIGNCGTQTSDPNHGTPYTDEAESAGPDASHLSVTGAVNPADTYLDVFPYLNTPLPGSPNGPNGIT
ncbi:MAG TPA: DUF4331 domain-containing protein [Steroidobacteraceae bacterium]|jgi:hypothetical protein